MACSVAATQRPLPSGSTYLNRLAASIWSWPTLPPSWTSWWPSATGRLTPICWGPMRRKSGFVMAVTWPLSWGTCSAPSVGMTRCPRRTRGNMLQPRLRHLVNFSSYVYHAISYSYSYVAYQSQQQVCSANAWFATGFAIIIYQSPYWHAWKNNAW